jgi:hypothetical protein
LRSFAVLCVLCVQYCFVSFFCLYPYFFHPEPFCLSFQFLHHLLPGSSFFQQRICNGLQFAIQFILSFLRRQCPVHFRCHFGSFTKPLRIHPRQCKMGMCLYLLRRQGTLHPCIVQPTHPVKGNAIYRARDLYGSKLPRHRKGFAIKMLPPAKIHSRRMDPLCVPVRSLAFFAFQPEMTPGTALIPQKEGRGSHRDTSGYSQSCFSVDSMMCQCKSVDGYV